MGSLFVVSLITLGILLSFVFSILILTMLVIGTIDIWIAIAFTVIINFFLWLLGPWFTDWINKWFYKVRFLKQDEFSATYPDLARAINEVSSAYHFPVPKIGIIPDKNPTAFTYGSGRWNARLILTEGIFHFLNQDEVKAVVIHELGHIRNRDFVVMMIGSTIIQILYQLYFALTRSSSDSKKGDYLKAVGLLAYVFYILGTFILLFLSRTREYLADQFSAEVTKDPHHLATALIKIAYGIVTTEDSDSTKSLLQSTRHLGIVDVKNAKQIGVASYISHQDPAVLSEVMVFDRVSPWAKLIELNSTHPLNGKRIGRLGELAKKLGKAFPYDVEQAITRLQVDQGRVGRGFALGLIIFLLPVLAVAAGLGLTAFGMPWPIILTLFGLAMLVQVIYRFPQAAAVTSTVLDEMRNPYASPVRGRKISLEGQAVGRGVPGFIFGEDLMFQDKTGLIFLDYNSIFGFIGDLFFALGKIKSLLGQRATAEGWFFRGLGSSLSLTKLQTSAATVHSHPVFWGVALPIVLIGLSFLLLTLSSQPIDTSSSYLEYLP